eukprot:g2566.t1
MELNKFSYVHLHGFLGSTQSRLGTSVREIFRPKGIDVHLLDLTAGYGYRNTSISIGLTKLDEFYQETQKPLRIMGNSMGGYIAALYTSRNPDKVNRLVLYNPAFNLEANWPTIVASFYPNKPIEDLMQQWKKNGEMTFPIKTQTEEVVVDYNYVLDSLMYPAYPIVEVPTKVFVGINDTLIPVTTHDEWFKRQKNQREIELIRLDDDHFFSSMSSLETIHEGLIDYFC